VSRVAVVTGASSGIGRALAKRLAEEGYAVGLTARRLALLEEAAAEIRAAGGTAAVAAADAADRAAVLAAIGSLAAALGPVDLLVANAGVGVEGWDALPDGRDLERMTAVNFLGAYYALEAVVPSMRERRAGHVVAISSLTAYRGYGRGAAVYCATKAALSTLIQGLRIDLGRHGIDVTLVHPGFVRTPMTANNHFRMPLLMSPGQAARLVAGAIRRKRRVFDFPWRLAFLARLSRWLPDAVVDWFLPGTPPDRR
jgi:NAD(P)-dependent dehydrogenase (short-subunit alcohol dehydrogenase family)